MGAPSRGGAAIPATGGRGRFCLPLLLAAAVFLLASQTASAAFHEILIREVYAGGASNDSYVVLQAYSPSQNAVGGHSVTAYGSGGTEAGRFTFGGPVSNGASQMTILVADTSYATTFGSGPSPDGSNASLNLDPLGGAVCWNGTPDCVAWGSFNGSLPSAAGSPVDPSGIPAGMAIRRSIAPGCATLLEFGDDSNGSSTDFFDATPNPRSNSSPIVEESCPLPPNTSIVAKPANPTRATSATFTYQAIPSTGSPTFECRLDADEFASCPSDGITYPGPLGEGSHTFRVRATNSAGTDLSPATYTWSVDSRSPPETTIDSQPADPSLSSTASFTYSSSEPGSTFECKLGDGPFAPCAAAGIQYTGLPNGPHSFQVRASDQVGNTDATPAGYSWSVAVPDPIQPAPVVPQAPTPPAVQPPPGPTPDTRIARGPRARSADRTPTFVFRSTVGGATFQCKLDRDRFRGCRSPLTTKRLAFGRHVMTIRARAGGKVDPTPARRTFKIVKKSKRSKKGKRKRGKRQSR